MKTFIICLLFLVPLAAFGNMYNAEVVSTSTSVTVKGNVLIKRVNRVIKINNSNGDQYTSVNLSYEKGETFSDLEAHIIDKNGRVVRKLKKRDINMEYGNGGEDELFEDTYDLSFQLNYDEYPYTLVYSYQLKTENPLFIAYWSPMYFSDIPTIEASLSIEIPQGYKMSYHAVGTDTLIKTSDEHSIKYTWRAHYTKILESETFAPDIDQIVPQVIAVPLHFYYDGTGSMKSWKAYGNWQDSVLRTLDKLPDPEQQKINSLLKGIKGKVNKIRVLYHYLQDETRYVNVVIKTGRMIPYPASYVAKYKYGDCKALSDYMVSMLKYAGIKAYCANIDAGDVIQKVDTAFPAPQFNHEIVYVPDSIKPIWLDCTSKYAFGWLGDFDQGRYAMVVEKNHSRLIRTPGLTPQQVEDFRKIDVSSNLFGAAFVKFDNTYRGNMYELVEAVENRSDPMYKQRMIRNYLVQNGMDLVSDSIHQINRDSTYVQFYYTGRSGQIYNQYGNNILVADIPFDVPDVESPDSRQLPIQINYPVYKVDSIRYEIPPGYKLSAQLKDTVLTTAFGKYSHRFYKKERSVFVTNRLLIYPGNYPLKVYGKFYRFLEAADKNEHAVVFAVTKGTP